jgi:hypothetical protein
MMIMMMEVVVVVVVVVMMVIKVIFQHPVALYRSDFCSFYAILSNVVHYLSSYSFTGHNIFRRNWPLTALKLRQLQ